MVNFHPPGPCTCHRWPLSCQSQPSRRPQTAPVLVPRYLQEHVVCFRTNIPWSNMKILTRSFQIDGLPDTRRTHTIWHLQNRKVNCTSSKSINFCIRNKYNNKSVTDMYNTYQGWWTGRSPCILCSQRQPYRGCRDRRGQPHCMPSPPAGQYPVTQTTTPLKQLLKTQT